MRARYWSCSNFADWIRGTPKPGAETSNGWKNWKNFARTSHPVRFWIAEEGLHHLQNFVNWPLDKLDDIRAYINNRWVARTHCLNTTLKKGQWHEYDTRLIHGMFDELVNFVEIEQAWHHVVWDEEARKKYQTPWYRMSFFRLRIWRCPEAGMAHLMWAAGLRSDDGKHLTQQAIHAKEIIDLYVWWKHIRPNRPEPYEVSGWSALCAKRQDDDDILGGDRTPEEQKEYSKALDIVQELEDSYTQEDEDMMIRLIKIRKGLWT